PIPGAPPSPVGTLPPGCPFRPRCSWAREQCRDDEPALVPVDDVGGRSGHRAACHASSELGPAPPAVSSA
ncbi:MAG: oligopeptide/dipeptide ABC transporter ATP-binding protein, partial [Acidimicrobiales bacterium]